VGRLPNPPLPTQPLVVPQNRVGDVTPQRQISAVSQLSTVPPNVIPPTDEPGLRVLSVDGGNVVSSAVVPPTPSPQVTPERQKTPENYAHEHTAAPVEPPINNGTRASQPGSPPQNVAKPAATQEPERPWADADPRDAIVSPHEGGREAIITPPSPIDDDGTYKLSPPPAAPADGEGSAANGLLNRQATIRQTSAEQFEEHKRKMLLAAQEEKIPVFPEEPAAEEAAEKKAEEAPQMSATSYPGQEWNPYGEFAYDEDEP